VNLLSKLTGAPIDQGLMDISVSSKVSNR